MRSRLRLAVFDLDGVLVEEKSSWAYLHRVFGTYEHVSRANYAKAFEEGDITYSDWMKLDLESLIGARGVLYCHEIEEVFSRVRLAEGASVVVDYLKKYGIKVAIVSAGIEHLALRVAKVLGINEVYANRLLCSEDGRLLPYGLEKVNPLKKGKIVEEIARRYSISLAGTMYVGDSAWDCSALEVVGYPVVIGNTPIQCGEAGTSVPLIYVSGMEELYLFIKSVLSDKP